MSTATAWFAVLMPWNKLPDPDAFYHATMARMTWEQGAVVDFPWLDLTTLGQDFADQHLLFHYLQAPFVHSLGLTQGSRISSLLLASLCLASLYLILYSLRLRPFWLWPLALAFVHPFSTRMVLGKASPLVIMLWMAALYALSKYDKTKNTKTILYVLCAAASTILTLAHGGWIVIPLSLVLMIVGDLIFSMALLDQKISSSLKSASWPILLSSIIGIVIGLVLHPGRAELIRLLWVQVIKIGVMTPSGLLPMGVEWDSVGPATLLSMTSVFGVMLILLIPGLAFTRKKIGELITEAESLRLMRLVIMWGVLVAVLAAMAMKSARYSEFFQPALAVWVAILCQFVDWKKLRNWFDFGLGRSGRALMPVILSVAFFSIIFQGVFNSYTVLHDKNRFYDNQYRSAMQAISGQAQKGDRVYHSEWDEFPVLFAQNQDLKYIAGLDPTFFYEKNPKLALSYTKLPFEIASSTKDQAWKLIHDEIGAKYAIIDVDRWPDLAKLLREDSRFIPIGSGEGAESFKLED